MRKAANPWAKPPVVVSVLGFILSLLVNVAQYRQNFIINEKADQEKARADAAAQRENNLQKEKEAWLTKLKDKLNDAEAQMQRAEQTLRLDSEATTVFNKQDQLAATKKLYADLETYKTLKDKYEDLNYQINDFIEAFH